MHTDSDVFHDSLNTKARPCSQENQKSTLSFFYQSLITSLKIIAEEQAGFRAGKSTKMHIFNLRILCEKYLQHQQDLYRVFIDLKKAFDSVWHAAL